MLFICLFIYFMDSFLALIHWNTVNQYLDLSLRVAFQLGAICSSSHAGGVCTQAGTFGIKKCAT
jgi:hypothetical protein